MVVPRSAQAVASDDEFTLYAVTTFKKHSLEFLHKSRESKWTPRDFKYKEGGKEAEQREVDQVGKEERKVWGEALRLGRTAWGEAVMAWVHVLALRVFVETVLRYGLPLSFVCGLVRVCHLRVPISSCWKEHRLTKNTLSRLRKNLLKRSETRSMAHILILAAMLSGETKKAESLRTTQRLRQRCKQPDTPAMEVNILHMSVTSLRSISHETIHPPPNGYIDPWLFKSLITSISAASLL